MYIEALNLDDYAMSQDETTKDLDLPHCDEFGSEKEHKLENALEHGDKSL